MQQFLNHFSEWLADVRCQYAFSNKTLLLVRQGHATMLWEKCMGAELLSGIWALCSPDLKV